MGVDLRDLRSGLSLRRVLALIKSLPHDAYLWRVLAAAEEAAKIPTTDKIRERQAHYAAKARGVEHG